jgi:hypothetical protein
MTDRGGVEHKRKKPRTCPHCSREFRRHEHLQRHLRIRMLPTYLPTTLLMYTRAARRIANKTDTNEKPYSCACGALFARRDLLKRHESLAHSGGETDLPGPGPDTGPGTGPGPETRTDLDTGISPDAGIGSAPEPGEWLGFQTVEQADSDIDPFQTFELLSRSLGFTTDWNLEPDQFMHSQWTQAQTQTQMQAQSHTGEVSQLPVEKDTIGRYALSVP